MGLPAGGSAIAQLGVEGLPLLGVGFGPVHPRASGDEHMRTLVCYSLRDVFGSGRLLLQKLRGDLYHLRVDG